MIYSIKGILAIKRENLAVLQAGGVGFKISVGEKTRKALPPIGETAELFCHLHLREDALELYGVTTEEELRFLELLNSISGIGPRTALGILDLTSLHDLAAAIKEGRPDLLTRASGVGRKTAERIIVELRGKVTAEQSEATVGRMEGDSDLADTLAGLGYRRSDAKEALAKVDDTVTSIEDRLKAALKLLGGKRA